MESSHSLTRYQENNVNMEVIELFSKFPIDLSLSTGRSPGLHVSQIYSDLEDILFAPRKTDNPLWSQLGFVWEILLESAFKKALGIRPGEYTLDGIIGSPDGVNYRDGYIEELKVSWKSAKRPIESIWRYMTQVKAYLKMTGLRVVRFRVFYVNGFYDGEGPYYRDCFITFTQEEIDNNWEMLNSHAKSKGWL